MLEDSDDEEGPPASDRIEHPIGDLGHLDGPATKEQVELQRHIEEMLDGAVLLTNPTPPTPRGTNASPSPFLPSWTITFSPSATQATTLGPSEFGVPAPTSTPSSSTEPTSVLSRPPGGGDNCYCCCRVPDLLAPLDYASPEIMGMEGRS